MTRREHIKRLLGLAAAAPIPLGVRPAGQTGQSSQRSAPSIPSTGIGRRIRHLSYSDQGGRPDGVQIMVNRRHVYVGHMPFHRNADVSATGGRSTISSRCRSQYIFLPSR
jgi:hypothetical protein